MITTSPQGERLCRQLAALLADPASWEGGVVPPEALPYLGAAPPGLPDRRRMGEERQRATAHPRATPAPPAATAKEES